MLLTSLLVYASTVAAIAPRAISQTYSATFSAPRQDCENQIDCGPSSYPYYDALYYKGIDIKFGTYSGSGNCYVICLASNFFYGLIGGGSTGVSRPRPDETNSSISANYAGSKVDFLTFQSFYAGCTAPVRGFGAPGYTFDYPIACVITVKGYATPTDPSGVTPPIAVQSFQYTPQFSNNPQGLPRAYMTQFTASPLFSTVRVVTFSAAFASSVNQTDFAGPPSIWIDNLGYTVYNRTI